MTDTPVTPPPTRLERLKAFLGDLARPYAIVVIASATCYAIIAESIGVEKLTAAGIIITALYASKTIENQTQARAEATQAKATAAIATATGQLPANVVPLRPAPPVVLDGAAVGAEVARADPTLAAVADDGTAPPWVARR